MGSARSLVAGRCRRRRRQNHCGYTGLLVLNPPARMPRAPTPARSPPPRPLRCGEITFRPTHDVGPHKQCISGLNHAAYGLPVNASRPGSPQAHASLGSGWRPTLAGWDWIPTGFRTRFQRSHHGILSPLTGLSRHTRCCTNRHWPARCSPTGSSPADAIRHLSAESGHPIEDLTAEDDFRGGVDNGWGRAVGPVWLAEVSAGCPGPGGSVRGGSGRRIRRPRGAVSVHRSGRSAPRRIP